MLRDFAGDDRVEHSDKEYVPYEEGRPLIHTNTMEGYFSVFKRGMRGTYQHCKEKHLHQYLAEFDFRYNSRIALEITDVQRAAKALQGIAPTKHAETGDANGQEFHESGTAIVLLAAA